MGNAPEDSGDQPPTQKQRTSTIGGANGNASGSVNGGSEIDAAAPDETLIAAEGSSLNAAESIAEEPAPSPATFEEVPATLGRYKLLSKLGQGGFGAVYRAHDTVLDRQVALKVPRSGKGDIDVEAFLKEAKRLAQLRHSSILTVHDVGSQDEYCYIVTDLLTGESLTSLLRRRRLDWRECVNIIAVIADALGHAHSRSMIHRDVKPGNIFINEDGTPVLLDFGLALQDVDEEQLGLQAGSPGYMAPEQVMGLAHRVDGRTDIYSLGAVLYEMLGGRRPFRANSITELFRRIEQDEPQPLRQLAPDVPQQLESICRRAMAKLMSERFTTAGDFAAALRGVEGRQSDSRVGTWEPTSSMQNQSDSQSWPDTVNLLNQGQPADHSTSGTSTMRQRREAELRRVTISIVNFEVLNSDASTEQRHLLRQQLADAVTDCVHDLDGVTVNSAGSEVVTCFGFPVASEHAAQRAVQSSLQILEQGKSWAEDLKAKSGDEIELWVMIHTGEAIAEDAGGEGAEGISLTGAVRDVAGRLEQSAEPWQVTITDATLEQVKGFFQCNSVGTQRPRGTRQPIELFEVSAATPARDRIELLSPGNVTPLVGRNTELAILKDRWEQACEQMGQVVLLIGDAGLGKSRLVREIREAVREESDDEPYASIELRSSPYHRNTNLYPVVDYFSRLLKFDVHPPHERFGQLIPYLQELGLADRENVSLMADLLSLPADERFPPLQLPPQYLKERTLDFLVEWLRILSEQCPLLFIVEDLHWTDPTTLEFLERHVREFQSGCVLSLLTFRPEFEVPWGSHAHQTQIALNRLTKRQMKEMIRKRLDGIEVTDDLIAQLIERTEGVPLFVEEYAKLIQDSSGQDGSDNSGVMSLVPPTLQDMLVARLDRIEGTPEVVQLAATIGREFSFRLMSAASELPIDKLQTELDKLVQAELLFQTGRGAEATYIFKHALLQDSAYNMLLTRRRQEFHRHVAEALESEFADIVESQPDLLAHHFTEAGLAEKGIPYWLKAGRKAQAHFANEEAISHIRRGLAAVGTLEEGPTRDQTELECQLALGTLLTVARGWACPEAESVHLRARQLCEQIGEGSPIFHVTWGMWAWRLLRSELDLAKELAEEVWRLAEPTNDPGYIMEACFARNCTSLFRGEFDRCIEFGEKGTALYDEEKTRFHASLTGQNSGCTIPAFWAWALWIAGYPDQAVAVAEEGVARGKSLDDPFSYAFALYHFGCVQQHCRMAQAAFESGEASVNIGKEQGFDIWIALGMLCKGSGLILSGQRIDEGTELVQQGFSHFRASGAELSLTHYYAILADAYRASGRIEDALEAVEEGLAFVEKSQERFHESNLNRLRGDLLLMQSHDNQSQAENCYLKAIEIAEKQAARSWELRATMSLARLWKDVRPEEARTRLDGIYNWFSEGFSTPDLVEARNLLDSL